MGKGSVYFVQKKRGGHWHSVIRYALGGAGGSNGHFLSLSLSLSVLLREAADERLWGKPW